MSDWEMVIEDGHVFWVHDHLGNIQQTANEKYYSYLPKVVRLGPFNSLGEAKFAIVNNKAALDKLIEDFNESVVSLITSV